MQAALKTGVSLIHLYYLFVSLEERDMQAALKTGVSLIHLYYLFVS